MRAAPPLAAALLIAACATTPNAPPDAAVGRRLAAAAAALVGTPYQFGGADAAGFDCSGLTRYVHAQLGFAIPRSAAAQQAGAAAVPLAQILPGDLLFFRIAGARIDHVGIYLGAQRFVHAPRAGLPVRVASLTSAFYVQHLAAAGRFWGARGAAP